MPYAYDWVAGEDLAEVLADEDEMTGGDFVRHVKQCIDLLRQISEVAPDPSTAETARGSRRLLPGRDRSVERRGAMSPPLRHGEPWGRAATGPPDDEVTGDDADLAAFAALHPGALVRFRPSAGSDLARAVGIGPDTGGTTEVAIDTLTLEPRRPRRRGERWSCSARRRTGSDGRRGPRVLKVRLDGRPWFDGRATTVVVANGQFLRRADVVPRGHPGDGWAEVQVYALARGERRGMRRRLPTGTHVPHPRVLGGRARRVEIDVGRRRLPLEVDGHRRGGTRRLVVTLVPASIRLLV